MRTAAGVASILLMLLGIYAAMGLALWGLVNVERWVQRRNREGE